MEFLFLRCLLLALNEALLGAVDLDRLVELTLEVLW